MQVDIVQTGDVLLAEPFMLDPNFKRTAVLLCEHGKDGSVGFILNRPLEVSVEDLVHDFPEFKGEVFYGGPVATDTIHYLHNVGDLIDDSVKVAQGVYWGGDFEKTKALIQSGLIEPSNIRFFVGYSSWSEGQLGLEMGYGSWITAQMDPNYLFNMEAEEVWQEVMYNKGNIYTVIAQMKDEVNWN